MSTEEKATQATPDIDNQEVEEVKTKESSSTEDLKTQDSDSEAIQQQEPEKAKEEEDKPASTPQEQKKADIPASDEIKNEIPALDGKTPGKAKATNEENKNARQASTNTGAKGGGVPTLECAVPGKKPAKPAAAAGPNEMSTLKVPVAPSLGAQCPALLDLEDDILDKNIRKGGDKTEGTTIQGGGNNDANVTTDVPLASGGVHTFPGRIAPHSFKRVLDFTGVEPQEKTPASNRSKSPCNQQGDLPGIKPKSPRPRRLQLSPRAGGGAMEKTPSPSRSPRSPRLPRFLSPRSRRTRSNEETSSRAVSPQPEKKTKATQKAMPTKDTYTQTVPPPTPPTTPPPTTPPPVDEASPKGLSYESSFRSLSGSPDFKRRPMRRCRQDEQSPTDGHTPPPEDPEDKDEAKKEDSNKEEDDE